MHISKSFSLIVIVAVVILCTAAATLSPAVEAANVSTAAVKTTPVVAAGVWHSETVDSPGDVGLYTSLQLNATGWPAISYYNTTTADLKYAYESETGWHTETVDSSGGMYPSLALTPSGWPAISYNGENGTLKYTYKNAAGWHTQTVDTGGVGLYGTSLRLTPAGWPAISYYDTPNGDLKYTYKNAAGWHTQTVDSTYDVGRYSSLALTSTGWPAISYYDNTNYDLKYSYKNATGWHNQTVDSDGSVGSFTSLALTSTNWPAISYYDTPNGDLKYAYKNAGGWHTQAVDSYGRYTSLALTSTGWPAISYYDKTNGTLKYTYKNAAGWHPEVVDSSGDVGQYSSLQLTPAGWPAISYYDSANGDLKYTYKDAAGSGDLDKWGIIKLQPTYTGREWYSVWDQGAYRTITTGDATADSVDKSGVGNSSQSLYQGAANYTIYGIDGDSNGNHKGEMFVKGMYPRIYCRPEGSPPSNGTAKWGNVEITLYGYTNSYNKNHSDWEWAGLEAVARTDHWNDNEDCGTAGYGARMLFSGMMDFEKEVSHGQGSYKDTQGEIGTTNGVPHYEQYWSSSMPMKQWIGFKYVVRCLPDNSKCQMDLYVDLDGGANGGNWQHVIAFTDVSGWSAGMPTDCRSRDAGDVLAPNYAIYLRTDSIDASGNGQYYKWFSVREIAPLQQ